MADLERNKQHNPQAPDGPDVFIAFVRAFPEIGRARPP
jgi:hypothetical protein